MPAEDAPQAARNAIAEQQAVVGILLQNAGSAEAMRNTASLSKAKRQEVVRIF